MAQKVKNSPVMQETQVQYLAQEDLEKGEDLEKISSILAWRILWTEEPGGLQSTGSQSCTPPYTYIHTHTHIYI